MSQIVLKIRAAVVLVVVLNPTEAIKFRSPSSKVIKVLIFSCMLYDVLMMQSTA